MMRLAALAVFSGLSLNLLLQFALGAAAAAGGSAAGTGDRRRLPVFQFLVMAVSVFALWVLFRCLPPRWGGFSACFLFFPFSALACMGLERLGGRFFPGPGGSAETFSALTAYGGLVPAALFMAFTLADGPAEALVLSLFFASGNMTAVLVLNEIRRRSALEWVPRYLRGSPLILISMGLLALVSGMAARICFRILEVF